MNTHFIFIKLKTTQVNLGQEEGRASAFLQAGQGPTETPPCLPSPCLPLLWSSLTWLTISSASLCPGPVIVSDLVVQA